MHAGLGRPKYRHAISINSASRSHASGDGQAETHAALNLSTLSHASRRASSCGRARTNTSKCWKLHLSLALVSAA
eukprot:5051595-Karenia_brevis.AAC.2